LAMPGWIRKTALEDILGEDYSGLSEDSLYRVGDNREGAKSDRGGSL